MNVSIVKATFIREKKENISGWEFNCRVSLVESLAILFALQQESNSKWEPRDKLNPIELFDKQDNDLHRELDKMTCRRREKVNPCFYCEGSWTQEQAVQRSCGASVLGYVYNLTGHGSGQPALADPVLSEGVDSWPPESTPQL